MTRVISTACTHRLPAGCHGAFPEDMTLPAGKPVDLSHDQAEFAMTLAGVEAVDGASPDAVPDETLVEEPDEIPEPPAAEPPFSEEP